MFSDIYLNKFSNVFTINDTISFIGYHNLEKMFISPNNTNYEYYCKFVLNNTFEGVFGDPLTEPYINFKRKFRKN